MGNLGDDGLEIRDIAPVEAGGIVGTGEKQRLLMQTLNEAQVDFLMQRTPKKEIKYRQGRGGLQFAYVEHGYVTERLNLVFGFNWDFEIVDKQILEDEVIVEARLTVRTPNGQTIVKTQFGGAEIKRHASGAKSGRPLSIADDYKAAASDALKKCASLLGIGLDLYGRDRPEEIEGAPSVISPKLSNQVGEENPGQTKRGAPEPPASIGARTPGLCTQAQLRQIQRLAGEAGMVIADLTANLGLQDLADLTEARAQRVIGRLLELSAQVRDAQAS
jgi:hypothetical protein